MYSPCGARGYAGAKVGVPPSSATCARLCALLFRPNMNAAKTIPSAANPPPTPMPAAAPVDNPPLSPPDPPVGVDSAPVVVLVVAGVDVVKSVGW